MEDLGHANSNSSTGKDGMQTTENVDGRTSDAGHGPSTSTQRVVQEDQGAREHHGRRHGHHSHHRRITYSHTHYKVYKRRWFGLTQLVLLNIVVSWDWLTFAPVSTTASQYFAVDESTINWLSTGFLFSFVVACPVVMWALHRGPKDSIMAASVLLLLGNWIRYAGTKANGGIFGVVMLGQIFTGLAQPFVLVAPTRYSDLWFTESGRVSATAIASLANPFGGALAQLINPSLGDIPEMVLYIAIIASVASIPSFFIPATPPTPPAASSELIKTPLIPSIKHILRSPPFYVVFLTFSVYVGFFNAFSSLINQILYPYGYSEDEAGICGAVLIVVGLVAAAVSSPILDRTHKYLLTIKAICPLIAIAYLAFIWAPATRGLAAPYALSAILGAASFSLLPIALEYLVEITFPASPEASSTICWAGGQLLGAIFIVVMDALKDSRPVNLRKVQQAGRTQGGPDRPPGHMYNALVFEAIVALVVLPFPLALGIKKLHLAHGEGRLRLDEHRESENGTLDGREP